MTYRHCPRCRLAIRRRVDVLTLENCPRCLARTALAVPLFSSPLNAVELWREVPAVGTSLVRAVERREPGTSGITAAAVRS